MDPTIKKKLEDKVCKTGGGRRIKKKKHKPFKKGFLLDKKNGLGDEFRKKQKQQQRIDACTQKTEVCDLLDPNEVLTEDDLIDVSKMDFDVKKNCTEECMADPDCIHKRELRVQYRQEYMKIEYHNNKVKLQNKLFTTKAEERKLKNDIKAVNQMRDQMENNIKNNIMSQMKQKGFDPKTASKEDIMNLTQQIIAENGLI